MEPQPLLLQGDHDIDCYVNSVSLHFPEPLWGAQISLYFIFYIPFYLLLPHFEEVTVSEWVVFLCHSKYSSDTLKETGDF